MFASDFLLGRVTVKGEVSNFKDHPSGHLYFTLKDPDAAISVIMYRGSRLSGLKCRLKDGLKVQISGSVTVYESQGRYQLIASQIEEDGLGDLYRQYLLLKEQLQEMGMFDASFKKPVPKYARTVGIVTASSGAALQDIRQITARRNPSVQLILSPAQVQGAEAPESIVRAIERLDALHPDVMIVGRGGGSFEDLNAFNDERVARAVFDADTPVISAVGHETDYTIIDFVSDLRAPTPSAAAELAVFDLNEYLNELMNLYSRMYGLVLQKEGEARQLLKNLNGQLYLLHPRMQLKNKGEELKMLEENLRAQIRNCLTDKKHGAELLYERLNALSPLNRLTGGYGYISKNEKPVSSVLQLQEGDRFTVTLKDGSVEAKAERIHNGSI